MSSEKQAEKWVAVPLLASAHGVESRIESDGQLIAYVYTHEIADRIATLPALEQENERLREALERLKQFADDHDNIPALEFDEKYGTGSRVAFVHTVIASLTPKANRGTEG